MAEPARKQAEQIWVYAFGGGTADGDASMKNLLGGKGANLAEMAKLGLPVPPGFTITTAVCTAYYELGRDYPATLDAAGGRRAGPARDEVRQEIRRSGQSAARFRALGRARLDAGHDGHGAQSRPERCGGRRARQAARGERFAYDCYRRFIQMYSNVVLGVGHDEFEHVLDEYKDRQGIELDTDMTARRLEDGHRHYKAMVQKKTGQAVPAGSARTALGRDLGGVRLVDE